MAPDRQDHLKQVKASGQATNSPAIFPTLQTPTLVETEESGFELGGLDLQPC